LVRLLHNAAYLIHRSSVAAHSLSIQLRIRELNMGYQSERLQHNWRRLSRALTVKTAAFFLEMKSATIQPQLATSRSRACLKRYDDYLRGMALETYL
jgi:hypothetical protein